MHPRWILPGITLLLASAIATPSPEYPQIGRLQAEAEKYVSSLKPEQKARYGPEQLRGYISQIGTDLEQGNYESVDQLLRQLRQLLSSDGAVKLMDELTGIAKTARDKRDAAMVESATALAERAAQTCLRATTTREFDPLLVELAEARAGFNRNYSNPSLQLASQKLDSAMQFARRWQDYIDKRSSGDERGAMQIMVELASSSQLYPLISRSELLQRTHPAPVEAKPNQAAPEREAVVNLKLDTIADLPVAIERLRPRIESLNVGPTDEGRVLLQQLINLQSGNQACEAGNLGRALELTLSFNSTPTAFDDFLQKLRQQLQFKILQRQLELPDTLAPSADKAPADYLLRIMAHAKAKEDWPLLLRAYDSYIMIAYNNARVPEWMQQDRGALAYYVAGLNNEKAGNKSSALIQYNNALKFPTKYLPVDDVAKRIKALNAGP